jgi:fucose permease
MYLAACGALLGLALVLNVRDRRMLALTALVGASIFTPVPRDTAAHFYLFCIAAEIVVGLVAWGLRTRASEVIAYVCAVLVITHILGYSLDGNPPFSPYRGIVKILELAELLACVAFSPILYPIIRNRHATTP